KEAVRKELEGQEAPALRVQSAAAAMAADTMVRVGVLANCDAPEPCAELASTLREARDEKLAEIGTRLLGLSSLLSKLQIDARGTTLTARLELPAEEATKLVDRLMVLQALRR